jgi:DNA repair exonuclease SbcCD nuclease subunit
VDVATDQPRRLVYPALDLSILAVPSQAVSAPERVALAPEGGEGRQVLAIHAEVEGEYPFDRSAADYGGAIVSRRELHLDEWSYVALGHYHTQHEVARNAWYAGSLEYIGPNLWGEWVDEKQHGAHGKGWLLVDLDTRNVSRRPVATAREVYDLDPILAEGLSAAGLDEQIKARVESLPGGIADKIVRLRVFGVARHVARELNHTAVRSYKAEALHFHLDLRRPETHRIVGTGAPGRRQTLPELVTSYLAARPLPAELDREAFVRLGRELMDSVERDWSGG